MLRLIGRKPQEADILRIVLPILAVVIALDQWTKWLVLQHLTWGESIEVVPGYFALVRVHNPGAAFGLLSDSNSKLVPQMFVAISLIALALLTWYIMKAPREARLLKGALGLVAAGALGNLIDRLRFGEVVDFILVHYQDAFRWPAFNIADSAITVGVILMILQTIFWPVDSDDSAGEPQSAD